MKKILLTLAILLMTSQAFAVDAVLRKGLWVRQYKLTDTGGRCENCLVLIDEKIPEVVIQTSSVDYKSWKETHQCVEVAVDVWECPWDDLDPPNQVYRSPTVMILEEAHLARNVTIGVALTELREKEIYLSFWHEYKMQLRMTELMAEMEADGLNDIQKRRSLESVFIFHGISEIDAEAAAAIRVNTPLLFDYMDYGLATISVADRRLLSILGSPASDWF